MIVPKSSHSTTPARNRTEAAKEEPVGHEERHYERKKETSRRYFVAVLELDDAVPRLKPKHPNLLVTKVFLKSSHSRSISAAPKSTVGRTDESFAPGTTCRTTPAIPKPRQQSWSRK